MQTQKLITTSVFRRLAQVALSLLLLIFILYKWVEANQQSQASLNDNAQMLINKMVAQSATHASHLMTNNQRPQLQQLLADLQSDPHIEQAIIYNQHGTMIAQSQNAVSAFARHQHIQHPPDAYTPINTIITSQPLKSIIVVQEIRLKKQLLGYLSINYYQQLLTSQNKVQQQKMMEEILLMVLLSAVMGFILTRGFARFSRNTFRVSDFQSK